MKLKELISDITIIRMEGNADIEIADITTDSRTVKQGDLFIAVRGTQTDSHIYINDVVQKGAHAIICEQIPEARQQTQQHQAIQIQIQEIHLILEIHQLQKLIHKK